MRTLLATAAVLAASGFAGVAHAQRQDWRSCAVTICSKGECQGPNSNLIVVAPANFADPGFGGEATMMQQLEALSERLYPSAQGWSRKMSCEARFDKSSAMQTAKAYIRLAQMPPASHEIKIANPFEIWKYSETAASTSAAGSTPAQPPKPEAAKTEPPKPASGEPMNFMMWVALREPINGENSVCFHAIKTKPAPERYRGQWPSLEHALPVIQSYFPMMLERCRLKGTPVSANVEFATDDISPAAKRASMQATIERWRKLGFPEVYISN